MGGPDSPKKFLIENALLPLKLAALGFTDQNNYDPKETGPPLKRMIEMFYWHIF